MTRASIGFLPRLMLGLLAASGAGGCAEVVVDEPSGSADGGRVGAAGEGFVPPGSTPLPAPASSPNAPANSATGSTGSGNAGGGNAGSSAGAGNPAAGNAGAGNAGAGAPVAMPAPVPIPSTGTPGQLLFSDDFEDGEASGWIADADDGEDLLGSWSVVDTEEGRAFAQLDDSFDDDSWAIGGNVSWTDVNFEARFRFMSVSDIEDAVAMLALRFQSRESYYYAEFRGDGSIKIRKRFDGSEPDLSSEDLGRSAVLGEWIEVGFQARGSSLRVTIDGVPLGAEVVDTDLAAGGIGLGVKENSAVEFDDVRVVVP